MVQFGALKVQSEFLGRKWPGNYVCRDIKFDERLLTPSMISIEPLAGQLGPKAHPFNTSMPILHRVIYSQAGHVPQTPPGMLFRSKMKRP
jgi:hypothetical protein